MGFSEAAEKHHHLDPIRFRTGDQPIASAHRWVSTADQCVSAGACSGVSANHQQRQSSNFRTPVFRNSIDRSPSDAKLHPSAKQLPQKQRHGHQLLTRNNCALKEAISTCATTAAQRASSSSPRLPSGSTRVKASNDSDYGNAIKQSLSYPPTEFNSKQSVLKNNFDPPESVSCEISSSIHHATSQVDPPKDPPQFQSYTPLRQSLPLIRSVQPRLRTAGTRTTTITTTTTAKNSRPFIPDVRKRAGTIPPGPAIARGGGVVVDVSGPTRSLLVTELPDQIKDRSTALNRHPWRYTPIQLIGEGSFAKVYLVERLKIGRQVSFSQKQIQIPKRQQSSNSHAHLIALTCTSSQPSQSDVPTTGRTDSDPLSVRKSPQDYQIMRTPSMCLKTTMQDSVVSRAISISSDLLETDNTDVAVVANSFLSITEGGFCPSQTTTSTWNSSLGSSPPTTAYSFSASSVAPNSSWPVDGENSVANNSNAIPPLTAEIGRAVDAGREVHLAVAREVMPHHEGDTQGNVPARRRSTESISAPGGRPDTSHCDPGTKDPGGEKSLSGSDSSPLEKCRMSSSVAVGTHHGGGFAVGSKMLKNYLGQSEEDRDMFACKVIPLRDEACRQKSFSKIKREAMIQQRLKHPNIVQLHGLFLDVDNIYFILEYCPNGSLDSFCQKHFAGNRLPESEAKRLGQQLLNACAHMTTKNVVHRDLKLQNLFLDFEWNIKVGDFGLARQRQHLDYVNRTFVGTPNYVAPEIVTRKGHTYKADVWSFGVIMYSLLCGSCPFECSGDPAQTLRVIVGGVWSFPPDLKLSPTAASLLKILLVLDPGRRPDWSVIQHHPFFARILRPIPSLPRSTTTEESSPSSSRALRRSMSPSPTRSNRARATSNLNFLLLSGGGMKLPSGKMSEDSCCLGAGGNSKGRFGTSSSQELNLLLERGQSSRSDLEPVAEHEKLLDDKNVIKDHQLCCRGQRGQGTATSSEDREVMERLVSYSISSPRSSVDFPTDETFYAFPSVEFENYEEPKATSFFECQVESQQSERLYRQRTVSSCLSVNGDRDLISIPQKFIPPISNKEGSERYSKKLSFSNIAAHTHDIISSNVVPSVSAVDDFVEIITSPKKLSPSGRSAVSRAAVMEKSYLGRRRSIIIKKEFVHHVVGHDKLTQKARPRGEKPSSISSPGLSFSRGSISRKVTCFQSTVDGLMASRYRLEQAARVLSSRRAEQSRTSPGHNHNVVRRSSAITTYSPDSNMVAQQRRRTTFSSTNSYNSAESPESCRERKSNILLACQENAATQLLSSSSSEEEEEEDAFETSERTSAQPRSVLYTLSKLMKSQSATLNSIVSDDVVPQRPLEHAVATSTAWTTKQSRERPVFRGFSPRRSEDVGQNSRDVVAAVCTPAIAARRRPAGTTNSLGNNSPFFQQARRGWLGVQR